MEVIRGNLTNPRTPTSLLKHYGLQRGCERKRRDQGSSRREKGLIFNSAVQKLTHGCMLNKSFIFVFVLNKRISWIHIISNYLRGTERPLNITWCHITYFWKGKSWKFQTGGKTAKFWEGCLLWWVHFNITFSFEKDQTPRRKYHITDEAWTQHKCEFQQSLIQHYFSVYNYFYCDHQWETQSAEIGAFLTKTVESFAIV